MKRFLTLLLALLLLFPSALAATKTKAKEGDVIANCKLTGSHRGRLKTITDGKVETYYDKKQKTADFWIEISAPEGEKLCALYFFWNSTTTPVSCYLRYEEEGEWQLFATVGEGMAEEYLSFPEACAVRLEGQDKQLSLCELSAFTDPSVPDWVHQWEPTPEKADILLLCAHPDDEYLFMGGMIPEYAGERGLKFVMAYLCKVSNTRISELLNGLWTAGCHYYPVLMNYPHKTPKTLKGQYKYMGGRDAAMDGVCELLNQYRPEVVVTHDELGEYGQGAHMVCADLLLGIIRDGERELDYPVKKLYLHLWEENQITLDWNQPLSYFDGQTGLEVADAAFKCHKSQQNGKVANRRGGTYYFKVKNGGSLDNAAFGLAYSSVGEDVAKNDFMENIPGECLVP